MAIACPVDLDTLKLRAEIQSIYARVATEPSGDFHFHRGPTYAAEMLGYDANALATLPGDTTASFAGREPSPTRADLAGRDGRGHWVRRGYGFAACRSGRGTERPRNRTSKEGVAKKYGVAGVNVHARKPH